VLVIIVVFLFVWCFRLLMNCVILLSVADINRNCVCGSSSNGICYV